MPEIRIENASVDIPVLGVGSRSIRSGLISAATGGTIKFRDGDKLSVRAIDSLSLNLSKGDRLGLVGHNGAGKSTLLRMMAGIYRPTHGRVRTSGRIAAIFDLGFGMDPDVNGWDNMLLRGIALGYSITELRPVMDQMAELSELGEFLDMPLRTYSAGMMARLAFAVSTSIQADIYLIDEGITAGDAAFMKKAQKRADELVANAGILVFASHADAIVQEWCNLGLWMEHGHARMFGPIDEVIEAYRSTI